MYDLDVRLLFRLYDNLIGNAAKHNEPGTTVYFALEDRRFDIRITIADDGKGMPEELKKTLFNPFVTGNRARTSGGGTGLGMTIAKRIVDLHGGSIRLVDPPEEGKATEFEIIFHKGDPQWA
jgi:signal transduction histidine kinase